MQRIFFENLARARKIYNRIIEPVCQHWALTRTEVDILLFLSNYPTMNRSADIVATYGLTKSHVSISVRHLEDLGYLERMPTDDRRESRLLLTAKAIPAAREACAVQEAFYDRIVEGISQEEMDSFLRISQIACDNLEKLSRGQ